MAFNRALTVAVVFLAALVNAATYTGIVHVIDGQNTPDKFLTEVTDGVYGITSNRAEAVVTSINTDSTGPSNLVRTVKGTNTTLYIGGRGLNSPADLNDRSAAIASLTNVNPTPPGSPPDGSNSESAIWKYVATSSTTGQLKPQWVNTDHSDPPTFICYYNETNNRFVLSGDAVEYNTVNQYTTIYPMWFNLISS